MEAVFKTHGHEFPTKQKAQQYERAVDAAHTLAGEVYCYNITCNDIAEAFETHAEEFLRVAKLFMAAKAPVKPRAKKAQPVQEAA